MGRPKFQVSQECAKNLPDFAHASEIARRVGVTRYHFLDLVREKGIPVHRQTNGSYIIVREEFLDWAWRTGRYKKS